MNRTKRSFTLSPETVDFLESIRIRRHAASMSAVLEEILQAARDQHERAVVDQAVASYYGSLSPEAFTETQEWGNFALGEFPRGEQA